VTEHVVTEERGMEQHAVTVVADPASADALAPLLDHWRHGPGLRLLPWSTVDHGDAHSVADLADLAELAELAAGSSAVLVVGPRQRSPRTVLPAPVLTAPDGRVVPAAWLPATSAADLARFARTAVTVHQRAATAPAEAGRPASDSSRTLVVLGERHPRFDRLADRIVRIGGEEGGGVQVRRATAYELSRDDLVDLLATGPALGVYVGHGRPVGWVGYAGTRTHHFADAAARPGHAPVAAVVSLTCQTASRRRTGLSFAESLPLAGVTAATLGAVTSTVHTGNARWALRIARDLGTARTIGDLVALVAPHDPHATSYRLLGDPTAPLLDAPATEAAHHPHPHPHPLEEAS
jgi:hypothetical protein